ncbi:MAG: amidohydrolase [Tannerella sp.]|jgi:hypothetical protein|nr:amidohydrolase [Tannerella sp.]
MKKIFFIFSLLPVFAFAQVKTKYPEIPRIDVHIHDADSSETRFSRFLHLRDTVKQAINADIAMWINLTQNDPQLAMQRTGGRMLSAFSTYRPAQIGIEYHEPEVFEQFAKQGYIGYKIWYGPYYRQEPELVKYPYVDDPAHDVAFSLLEKHNVFIASLHIADPNGPFEWRTQWAADPVEYWREIIGLERVLYRHPNLNIVVAHGAWLMTQDAQIDFLRYLLDTYPNCNLDISATINYVNLPSYDNLRDFYIKYQDRLCWSTDNSFRPNQQSAASYTKFVENWFRFLETDDVFGAELANNKKPIKGLNLPREVIEKLYYKNAIRIYPEKLKESMKRLGYAIE